jgi:Ca2+-transporting ATPase
MVNRRSVTRWLVLGFIVAASALAVLSWGPDEPSTTDPSISMTMAFGIVTVSVVNLGLVMRRAREPAWSTPLFPYFGWIMFGWFLAVAAIELPMLQRVLLTVPLTGSQWLLVLGLSLITPVIVEIDKAVLRHRSLSPSR